MDGQDWNTVTINPKKIDRPKTTQGPRPDVEKVVVVPKDLSKSISQARTAKGLSQKDLAGKVCISQQVLSKWESGREVPSNAEIAKLEKFLSVKLPRTIKKKVNPE
jgi:ribosome-binding protein aMBF1 (putative translation factor)